MQPSRVLSFFVLALSKRILQFKIAITLSQSGSRQLFSLDGNDRPRVRLPREAGAVAQALHSGALQLMPVVLVNECQCQKCGASYFCCECSTFTEEECSVSMTQCEPLGCFLTERPAFPGPRFEAPRPEDAVDPESGYCQSFAPPPP